jgi:hypothetical protein
MKPKPLPLHRLNPTLSHLSKQGQAIQINRATFTQAFTL